MKYKRDILHEQCYLHRLAQATFDIYTMAVVLSRCTSTLQKGLPSAPYEELLTKLWCHEVIIIIFHTSIYFKNENLFFFKTIFIILFQASERAMLNLNMTEDKNYEKSFKNYSKVAGMICENGGLVQMNPLNI